MKEKENIKITEKVTTEIVPNTQSDPTIDAHLPELQKLAKSTKKKQSKVLASGLLRDGFTGERVLLVKPNGEHSVIERKAK